MFDTTLPAPVKNMATNYARYEMLSQYGERIDSVRHEICVCERDMTQAS